MQHQHRWQKVKRIETKKKRISWRFSLSLSLFLSFIKDFIECSNNYIIDHWYLLLQSLFSYTHSHTLHTYWEKVADIRYSSTYTCMPARNRLYAAIIYIYYCIYKQELEVSTEKISQAQALLNNTIHYTCMQTHIHTHREAQIRKKWHTQSNKLNSTTIRSMSSLYECVCVSELMCAHISIQKNNTRWSHTVNVLILCVFIFCGCRTLLTYK